MGIQQITGEALPRAVAFLGKLVSIPSTSGNELEAAEFVEKSFLELGCRVRREYIEQSITRDPLYCTVIGEGNYEDRFNLSVIYPGVKDAQDMVVNTHMDVVPPLDESGFKPYVENGLLYGRGSCDAKGQIATVYLAFLAMKEAGLVPPSNITAHFVVEEEVGGNGALSLYTQPQHFHRALVMESTDLAIKPAVRGAVWFNMHIEGISGHVGAAGSTRNPILSAAKAITVLERCHDELLKKYRDTPFFEDIENPMPLVIGKLHSGNWPATVPDAAEMGGVFGYLPLTDSEAVMRYIREALFAAGLLDYSTIEFPFRRNGHILRTGHPYIHQFEQVCNSNGLKPPVLGMNACTDGWFYASRGIPTIVFGPGNVAQNHARTEFIRTDDLRVAANVLGDLFLLNADWPEN